MTNTNTDTAISIATNIEINTNLIFPFLLNSSFLHFMLGLL